MAEDKTAVAAPEEETPPDGVNVEKRLSKLEELLTQTTKRLEEELKASAGKDKKITELSQAKKELQESTLSKDKLLEIRQKELEEAKGEWEQQRAAEKIELEKLKVEQLKTQVLSKLENFPSFLIDRIRGQTAEEIEADARQIMSKWVKERDKVDNSRKVTGKPRSGSGKQINYTAEDVKAMSPKEKMEWAKTAGKDEYDAVFDELHSE